MSRTKRNTDRGGGKEWDKAGERERGEGEEEFLAGSNRTTCSGSSTQVHK